MSRYTIYIFLLLSVFVIGLNSFTGENADVVITQTDIRLNIPGYFPKPLYDFNSNKVTPGGFMLGRKLFYDPILSNDSTISCGSCHLQSSAFARANQTFALGINSLVGKRNIPSLENLIWKNNFMLDGRVGRLEAQPLSPITNPIEMNETFARVLFKLRRNKEYVALFKQAFNGAPIDSEKVLKALAQFTGMLISSNSRYDKYLRGEEQLTASELHGFKLFRLFRCENCHLEPLFTNNSFEEIALDFDPALRDSGRMAITGHSEDYMKFKVPSLRNVELTAPYMHDGRFKTLGQVIDNYSNIFFTDNKALKGYDARLNINDSDKEDIIAFLKTLTDKDFINDRRFANPNESK